MELFKQGTVNLNHGFFGKSAAEPGKSRMVRLRNIQGEVKKGFKRKPVIDLAFKLRVGFDLKPFLKQKAFKQEQRRIGSFTAFGFTSIIVFYEKLLNGFPVYGIVDLAQK